MACTLANHYRAEVIILDQVICHAIHSSGTPSSVTARNLCLEAYTNYTENLRKEKESEVEMKEREDKVVMPKAKLGILTDLPKYAQRTL